MKSKYYFLYLIKSSCWTIFIDSNPITIFLECLILFIIIPDTTWNVPWPYYFLEREYPRDNPSMVHNPKLTVLGIYLHITFRVSQGYPVPAYYDVLSFSSRKCCFSASADFKNFECKKIEISLIVDSNEVPGEHPILKRKIC